MFKFRLLLSIILLLLCFHFPADAQNIITAEKYNRGIYHSFNDMYNNRPIDQGVYKVISKSSDEYIITDTISDKDLKDVYGYCDGNHIYLNRNVYSDNNTHWPESNRKRYVKILEVGRYMFFVDGVYSKYANLLSRNSVVASTIVRAATYTPGGVLDTKTGEIILLSEKKFKTILSEYPDLLERYKKLPSAAQGIGTKQSIIRLINAKQK